MRNFFVRNIGQRGRIVRAVWGLALIVAGLLVSARNGWLCIALLVAGGFALYERRAAGVSCALAASRRSSDYSPPPHPRRGIVKEGGKDLSLNEIARIC